MTKPTGPKELKTGNNYIEHAKKAGALITPSKKRGFTKIETPRGSTYVTPGTQPLDYRTRKNLNRWFRLLGLLTLGGVLLTIVDFIWGVLQLPPLW